MASQVSSPIAPLTNWSDGGYPFAHIYEAGLDMKVYDSLLDLTARAEKKLAELKPRDRIDVQSFTWVIGGSYDE